MLHGMPDTLLPSLFVSHGPPTMVLDDLPEAQVLAAIALGLPRPTAILCVSAHWIEDKPTLSTAETPETIHDFYGFPQPLYALRYPAPGAPALARRAAALLRDAGIDCALDPGRGLDHGAWEPLMLMFPDAEIPVAQLSLSAQAGGAAHMAIGRALAPLRAEGVLILGSGTATHNLREWRAGGATPDWAQAFEDWLVAAVAGGDTGAIAHYRDRAPHAARAHPSAEHFLPLPVAMGAGRQLSDAPGIPGQVLHRGFSYGSLSMAIFAFGIAAR
jgi:4,5-DOPA dioxygenase extradiol